MNRTPKVGVAIIISRNDKVLLIKRKNVHGAGSWSAIPLVDPSLEDAYLFLMNNHSERNKAE